MLKKQLISFLFTGVLMANLGHNIIPHHHHTDPVYSHRGCQKHDDSDAIHKDDPKFHCHAFNGIEYFPGPDEFRIDKPLQAASGISLLGLVSADHVCSIQVSTHEPGGSPPVHITVFGHSSGLRAPPVLPLTAS